MDIRIESHGDIDVLCLSGRLDLVSSSVLKDRVRQHLRDRRCHLVIACDDLSFVNSSGLGALISVLKNVRLLKGHLALCGLMPYVDEVFEITGLKKVFDTYATRDEAIGFIASSLREEVGAV